MKRSSLVPTLPVMILVVTAVMWAVAAMAGHANANAVVFDFEEQPDTGFSNGAFMSLTVVADGLQLTISRPGTPNQFDFYDVNDIGNPTLPASWGSRSLNPWFSNEGTAFVGTFDRPVRSVSLEMGDFGQDPDDLVLQAFDGVDGTGSLLDEATFQLPSGGSDFTAARLSVDANAVAIRSIRFIGGTDAFDTPFGTFSIPNSVYYDNISVVIPEPSTLSLSLLAVTGLLALLRRRI